MHKKVLDCIRGISQPTEVVIGKLADDSSKTIEIDSKEKTWGDIDRYQQMSEREKKAFSEAPSDPRKRRKISESMQVRPASSSSDAVQPSTKKSPRPEESSPKRARPHSSHVSTMIQAKSSLASIWADHMSLTASRLHEEFLGRRMSVNNKYELYQRESDPSVI